MYYILFTQFPVEKHLGCFYLGVIMNEATMDMYTQDFMLYHVYCHVEEKNIIHSKCGTFQHLGN